MLLLDYVFAVVCPECKDTVFNLYEWQLGLPICLKCARNSLQIIPGSIQCVECKKYTMVEKASSLLVEKNNKRVRILDEYLYCMNCETEAVTALQLDMKKYRIAIALSQYKKPK